MLSMRSMYRRLRHGAGFAALLLVAAAVPPAVVLATAAPAQASFGISQRYGVDACGLNSTSRATAFWKNTPYSNIGVYIGGANAACPMNSASFIKALVAQGWQ